MIQKHHIQELFFVMLLAAPLLFSGDMKKQLAATAKRFHSFGISCKELKLKKLQGRSFIIHLETQNIFTTRIIRDTFMGTGWAQMKIEGGFFDNGKTSISVRQKRSLELTKSHLLVAVPGREPHLFTINKKVKGKNVIMILVRSWNTPTRIHFMAGGITPGGKQTNRSAFYKLHCTD